MSSKEAFSNYSLAGSISRRYQYQLALALLYSRRFNFRLLESHGHGLWGMVGEDLLKGLSDRTLVVPQLNYTSSIQTNALSPETSIDTVVPPSYKELIPDFTGLLICARDRDNLEHAFFRDNLSAHSMPIPQFDEGIDFSTVPRGYTVIHKGSRPNAWETLNWHLFKLGAVITLILFELKRPPSRRMPYASLFFESLNSQMSEAQTAAVKQALLVFRIERHREWIVSFAVVGEWWTFRISTSPKHRAKAPTFKGRGYEFLDEDNSPRAAPKQAKTVPARPRTALPEGFRQASASPKPVKIPGPLKPTALQTTTVPPSISEQTTSTPTPSPTGSHTPTFNPTTPPVPTTPVSSTTAAAGDGMQTDPKAQSAYLHIAGRGSFSGFSDAVPAARLSINLGKIVSEMNTGSQLSAQTINVDEDYSSEESDCEDGDAEFNNFPVFDPANPEADHEGLGKDEEKAPSQQEGGGEKPALTSAPGSTHAGDEFARDSSAEQGLEPQSPPEVGSEQPEHPLDETRQSPAGKPKKKKVEKSPHPIRYLQHDLDGRQETFVWKLRDAIPPSDQWSDIILFGTPASNQRLYLLREILKREIKNLEKRYKPHDIPSPHATIL
ncbi:hypothetical protein CC1G_11142 [Coprinopsis cinerea okayama7|uniref:Uncharacterized protein n=1 Tax=Coprinopsis cinerea (strain Okayama-7 / 130 / ATCC MYA-4618 / FGSC 9003) TaxID=240176 RepID=A8N4S6_COPC7|nr:hypothetical protein CC1G_11142 [Coprinopsis cinerea okayama7\|eukprot:XP_001829872.2 hypothetical protein CC1G_11142 [Coprinopsis cinerea okayama7\